MDRFAQEQLIEASGQSALPHRVKYAFTHMRANIGEQVTLAGLAAACAMPQRTLLKQFRKFIGLSPLACLLRLRLNAAHDAVLNPDDGATIADIAARCGFTHLGRFASAYRSAFQESPSATRRRMRAPRNPGRTERDGHREGGRPNFMTVPHVRPSLVILPLSTETLKENQEARQLTE